MKKTLLSLVAISALPLTVANAGGSSELNSLKAQMAEMSKKIDALESTNGVALNEKFAKATVVKSKAPVLKFSGKHYLGFSSMDDNGNRVNFFETRRNYLQVKAYFAEDPKSYGRITLDTHQVGKETIPGADGDISVKDATTGDWTVRLKYAYLYLDDILPFTGVEFGQAHRPWIDYEEHHGWNYRSISKTFVEAKNGGDFTNSADLGVNFKTKTEYFSSEIGIYNGEGYHGSLDKDEDNGLSFEWRLTAHLLGTGEKHVHKHDSYADVSFYGQLNQNYSHKGDAIDGDFNWYGINAVYNQAEFLIAANYLTTDKAGAKFAGNGWSVNGELRMLTFDDSLERWNIIGRYDNYDLDSGETKKTAIAGLAYKWNKNVEFIANYLDEKQDYDDVTKASKENKGFMFTAEVNW